MVGGSINRSLLNKAKFKLLMKDICIEETSIYGLPFTSLTTLCDNQMERDMCIRTHERKKRIPRKDIRMYLLEPIFKIDWSRSYFLFLLYHFHILRNFHSAYPSYTMFSAYYTDIWVKSSEMKSLQQFECMNIWVSMYLDNDRGKMRS